MNFIYLKPVFDKDDDGIIRELLLDFYASSRRRDMSIL